MAFLEGKGFSAEEIKEAQQQANEILSKRREAATAVSTTFGASSSSSGGSGSSAPWPLTRVAAPGGHKASARVTVGGLSFISLSSSDGAAGGDGEAAAAALLEKLEASKADVAVVLLVVGPGQSSGAHRALDGWVDPDHLPARQVIEQGGPESDSRAQLFAVVRAR